MTAKPEWQNGSPFLREGPADCERRSIKGKTKRFLQTAERFFSTLLLVADFVDLRVQKFHLPSSFPMWRIMW